MEFELEEKTYPTVPVTSERDTDNVTIAIQGPRRESLDTEWGGSNSTDYISAGIFDSARLGVSPATTPATSLNPSPVVHRAEKLAEMPELKQRLLMALQPHAIGVDTRPRIHAPADLETPARDAGPNSEVITTGGLILDHKLVRGTVGSVWSGDLLLEDPSCSAPKRRVVAKIATTLQGKYDLQHEARIHSRLHSPSFYGAFEGRDCTLLLVDYLGEALEEWPNVLEMRQYVYFFSS
jgi:hypothetical protein